MSTQERDGFLDNLMIYVQIEGVAVIAKIVQNFDYDLDPNQAMNVIQELTAKPIDGTKIVLRLRK